VRLHCSTVTEALGIQQAKQSSLKIRKSGGRRVEKQEGK